jgi:hypothetical protein
MRTEAVVTQAAFFRKARREELLGVFFFMAGVLL